SFMPLDRNFNYIGFAMKVPPSAGLSLGWIHAGNDDFDSYSMIGEKTDPIANSMNALYFNFARTFKGRFAIGLSYKYFWEMINNQDFDYLSKGWGFDFGLRFMIMESLFVGASVRDVGSKLKVNTTEIFGKGGTTTDRFPVKYGLGCFYKTPLNWLNVLYDFEWSDKEEYRHHIGLEALYTMGNNTEKNVAVRMGWDDDKFTAGAGMGFILYKFISQLDYALVTADDGEGVSHVFSWQVYF
ncbi:MAG: hypothetical protein JXB44_00330, partial [Calditrichaceae bacterium]|nr:hypothetical protein [Calditrichaceae bacterium]